MCACTGLPPSSLPSPQADVEKGFRAGSIALMRSVGDKFVKHKVGETMEYKVLGREVIHSAVTMFNRYFTVRSIMDKVGALRGRL